MGIRYNKVLGKHAREIVLLKSFPCCYGKCSFCNYIEDNSEDEDFINQFNEEILQKISGEFEVLEVINSGSIFEIPKKSLQYLRKVIYEKNIKILYLEVFYSYLPQLESMEKFFNEEKEVEIRYRMGIESFDDYIRQEVYNKKIPLNQKILENLSSKIYSICLLIATKGQTKQMIEQDIELGLKYFKAITINVFIENGTKVKRDESLVRWFVREQGHLFQNERIEILIDNKDLGVYEQ